MKNILINNNNNIKSSIIMSTNEILYVLIIETVTDNDKHRIKLHLFILMYWLSAPSVATMEAKQVAVRKNARFLMKISTAE